MSSFNEYEEYDIDKIHEQMNSLHHRSMGLAYSIKVLLFVTIALLAASLVFKMLGWEMAPFHFGALLTGAMFGQFLRHLYNEVKLLRLLRKHDEKGCDE